MVSDYSLDDMALLKDEKKELIVRSRPIDEMSDVELNKAVSHAILNISGNWLLFLMPECDKLEMDKLSSE